MQNSEIEQLLIKTFEDLDLSDEEKKELKEIFEQFSYNFSKLSFVRNKAFEIVKKHLSDNKTDIHFAIKWLEKIIKLIDQIKTDHLQDSPEAFFSPGTDCANKIISLIKNAKTEIKICVFTISDNEISERIITAHHKGVKIKIITDNDKQFDTGSDIAYLDSKGVPIKTDNSPNHMHHKFALVDKKLLINGSFNWTRSASKFNDENIIIHHHKILIDQFTKRFDDLWKKCKKV